MRRSVNDIFAGLLDTPPQTRELVAAALRARQIELRRLRDSSTEGLPLAAIAMWEQEQVYKLLIEMLQSE